VEIIKQIIEYQNKEPFVISDPIIGENGSLYPGMPENSIAASQLMALEADLIIPNLTELCFILEEEYPVERKLTHEQMIAWLMKIKDRGIKSVVVTSVPIDSECYVYGYSQTEDIFRVKIDYVPIEVGGTGDMFTSLLIGSYVDKRTLEDSVKYATGIITKIILKEYKEGRNNKVNEIKVQNHLPYIYKTL
ncbi:MAG: PfkB family carbohydrate kinase, partial [Atopostipes sp.]|nr:PfkB family carbohydrate kinase [Atopostipes sp.]